MTSFSAKVAILGLVLFCLAATCSALSTKNRINTIPNLTPGAVVPETYNGYLLIRPEIDAHLFYWFTPSEQKRPTDPLILWLNGGPGCSSLVGMFFENGPFTIQDPTSLTLNPTSWTKFAHMLYIDQPLSVGLSYPWEDNGQIPSDSPTAAKDLFAAMKEFFNLFPDYRGKDFYFAGESYAGKYIPNAYYHFYQNIRDFQANIKGILLGNAMIKPSIQYTSYSIHGYTSGIVSYRQRVEMNMLYEKCLIDQKAVDVDNMKSTTCSPLFLQLIRNAGRLSPFDVREHYASALQTNMIVDYLVQPAVKAAFQISDKSNYHKCYSIVHAKFAKEFYTDVPFEVLSTMIGTTKVLLYNGQFDLRVSSYGTSEMLRRFNWPGRQTFNSIKSTPFVSSTGIISGLFKSYSNLTYMTIYGGSHMTPVTRPQTSFDMAQRWIFQNQNLCPPNDLGCQNFNLQCPNMCSENGDCDTKTMTCKCRAPFYGEDCSMSVFNVPESSQQIVKGALYGREAIVYQFKLNSAYTLLNIGVTLDKGNDAGLPFLFVNVSSGPFNPTPEQVREHVRERSDSNINGFAKAFFSDFKYYNLSHGPSKFVKANDVPIYRAMDTVVSVTVFNGNDAPSIFNLTVSIQPSNGATNWIFISVVGSVVMIGAIAVELAILISRYNKRKQVTSAAQYRHLIEQE
jgi:vitellogenic carboxypeptidase-like protein